MLTLALEVADGFIQGVSSNMDGDDGLPRSSFFSRTSPSSHASLHGRGGATKYSTTLKISTRFVVPNSSTFP